MRDKRHRHTHPPQPGHDVIIMEFAHLRFFPYLLPKDRIAVLHNLTFCSHMRRIRSIFHSTMRRYLFPRSGCFFDCFSCAGVWHSQTSHLPAPKYNTHQASYWRNANLEPRGEGSCCLEVCVNRHHYSRYLHPPYFFGSP